MVEYLRHRLDTPLRGSLPPPQHATPFLLPNSTPSFPSPARLRFRGRPHALRAAGERLPDSDGPQEPLGLHRRRRRRRPHPRPREVQRLGRGLGVVPVRAAGVRARMGQGRSRHDSRAEVRAEARGRGQALHRSRRQGDVLRRHRRGSLHLGVQRLRGAGTGGLQRQAPAAQGQRHDKR